VRRTVRQVILVHLEALGIAPEGDIATDALGQRTQYRGEVLATDRATGETHEMVDDTGEA
jgi:hypothetical protein